MRAFIKIYTPPKECIPQKVHDGRSQERQWSDKIPVLFPPSIEPYDGRLLGSYPWYPAQQLLGARFDIQFCLNSQI